MQEMSNKPNTHLQHGQDSVKLVLSEGDVVRDFSHGMYGLQTYLLNFIIKHVNQEIKALLSKRG